jgi:hypothetical protein
MRGSNGGAGRPPTFPALHSRTSADLLHNNKQLQQPLRSSSPLRRQQQQQQHAGSGGHSYHQQSHPHLQQQQQHKHGLVKRSASDVSPERMRPAAGPGSIAAAAAHQQHLQPHAAAALSNLKRLHMQGHAAAATAQDTQQLRRYSSGGYLQSSIDLASLTRGAGVAGALAAHATNTGSSSSSKGAAINTGGSASNDKVLSYHHVLGQMARAAAGGACGSSPYDAAPTSARSGGGRRRHHHGHSRQRGMPGVWL